MALGTITITPKVKQGPIRADICSFAGDGAYPTGGTADFEGLYRTALAEAGLPSPAREVLGIVQIDVSGYVLRYDDVNDKLMVLHGDFDPAAAGPLVDVPNATDLDGITFRCLVFSI